MSGRPLHPIRPRSIACARQPRQPIRNPLGRIRMRLQPRRHPHRLKPLPGSLNSPTSVPSSLPASANSPSSSITAAPAATIASALRFWCSSAAAANGTSRLGFPAAASSATVEAPLRAITRLASPNRAGMSSINGRTSITPQIRSTRRISRLRRLPDSSPRSGAESSAPAQRPVVPSPLSAHSYSESSPPATLQTPAASASRSAPHREPQKTPASQESPSPRNCENHFARIRKIHTAAAACTRLPTSRFAIPGIAFGSNAIVGTPIHSATAIAGPDA